jgi:hypothetical protein
VLANPNNIKDSHLTSYLVRRVIIEGIFFKQANKQASKQTNKQTETSSED